ncbi:16884_t:CDS:2 [Gigaspora rosea]|nr:16884_t:CDS:2 [Gigaspora rosea]
MTSFSVIFGKSNREMLISDWCHDGKKFLHKIVNKIECFTINISHLSFNTQPISGSFTSI